MPRGKRTHSLNSPRYHYPTNGVTIGSEAGVFYDDRKAKMITVKQIHCWENVTPASFSRVADLLRFNSNLPELLKAPTLSEIGSTFAARMGFIHKTIHRAQLARVDIPAPCGDTDSR